MSDGMGGMGPSTERPYRDFGSWLGARFPFKVRKVAVDAGFTCPNRDGRVGVGGCSFCDNVAFNPPYCARGGSVGEQIRAGREFLARKYPGVRCLAYFQAHTNTYADLGTLEARYGEALSQDGVVGLVIATRPDAVDGKVLDFLADLSRRTFLVVEYGIESANDLTLGRMNRGHDFACSCRAVAMTKERGIITGGHVILGFPGEGEREMLRQARLVSAMGLDILKIHHLQVIRGTALAREYTARPFRLFTAGEYVGLLARYIERLDPGLVLERFVSQSPRDMVLAPDWGLKNQEITEMLVRHMRDGGMFQGRLAVR